MWVHIISFTIYLTISSVLCEVRQVDSSQTFKELLSKLERPLGVFYYHHVEQTEFASRTQRIMDQVEYRMEDYPFRFMDLASLNCASASITTEQLPACASMHRQFLVYLPTSKEPEKFSLRSLPDTDSFIAEMIFYIYSDDIHLVPSKSKLDELIESSKGKKDVVFTYIDSLGSPDHYEFMVLYLRNWEKYTLVFATDMEVAKELGKKEGEFTNDLWCFRCLNKECEMEAHHQLTVMEVDTMERLLNQKKTPPVSRMNEDGTTVYDSVSTDIYRIFFLLVETPKQGDQMMDMMTRVVERCEEAGILIRGVVADIHTHSPILNKEFGVHSAFQLPTVLTVGNFHDQVAYSEGSRSKEQMDHGSTDFLLPDETMSQVSTEFMLPDQNVTEENVFRFVERITKNVEEHHNAVAALYHIYCVDESDWVEMQKFNHSALVAVCTKDPSKEEGCAALKRNFRHLVRTLTMLEPSVNLNFVYLQKPLQSSSEHSISLHNDGKVSTLNKVEGYQSMVTWLNTQLKTNLLLLVPTGADYLPIPLHMKYDENKNIEAGEHELSFYQEDEIALAAHNVRQSKFYSDQTPSLTDENFEQTVNASKLMLAFFYIPEIDDVSYLTEPMIDQVRQKVENTKGTSDIKVAKINCENQQRACTKANVHTFPLIRFYSEGVILGTYKGVLESNRIHQSLLSYQHPSPQKLDQNTLPTFINSALEKSNRPSVIGWFATENEELALFKEVSHKYRSQMTFAYGMGESTKKLFPHPPQTSTVIAYVQGELSQVLSADIQGISEASLNRFIQKSTLLPFGEITVDNFLAYKSLNKSLLVVFVKAARKLMSSSWNAVSGLRKEDITMHGIVKVWMNTETKIGEDIRKSYLGMAKESAHGDIVFVDFKKAEVYHYPLEHLGGAAQLLPWIEKCVKGSIKATKYLNVLKFKPLREGFDFLTLIDKNLRYPGDKGKEHDGEENESGHEQRRRFPHMASSGSEKDQSGSETDDLLDVDELSEESRETPKEPLAFDMDESVEVSHKVIDTQIHEEL